MIKRANECHCGGDTRVKWTRTNEHTGKVQRRRECRVCGHRWTTLEVVTRGGLITQADIDALKVAIAAAKGARSVAFSDPVDMNELLEAMASQLRRR